MALPGFFLHVDLGNSVLANPTENTNVENLNFAVVMHDDEAPVKSRWTTWGLEADSMLLYQAQNKPNAVLVGNNGFLYRLEENTHTDAGAAIPITLISAPLPSLGEKDVAATMTRVQEIKWSVRTTPPSTGLTVELSLIDVDNGTTVIRTVYQYTQQMHVRLAMRARQFRIKFVVTGGTDFDLSYLAYKYQTMSTRKTTRQQ